MASQRTFVQPTLPPVPGIMELSPLDQIGARAVLPLVLAFAISPSVDRSKVLSELQSSLALTLKEMPFLTANAVLDSEERDTLRLEIPPNAGVWFYSRDLPDLDFEDLERRGFPSTELHIPEVVPGPFLFSYMCPVLTIQANFITGGLLLTSNMHHSVMDGAGMAIFLIRWAKHLTALSEGRLVPPEDALPQEALDRSSLFGGYTQKKATDFHSYRATKDLSTKPVVDIKFIEAAISGNDHQSLAAIPQLELIYWRMPADALCKLEKAAVPPSSNLPRLTQNSILSALIWRHLTRARQLATKGYSSTAFLFAVDTRLRLDPPLPSEYAGNAILYAKANATLDDIDSSSPEMLYELARRITEAADWWTADRMWEFLGAVNAIEDFRGMEMAGDIHLGSDIDFSSVGWMQMDKFNWGPTLGAIKGLRLPNAPVRDGHASIMPRTSDGALEIAMMIERDAITRLKEDKEWALWAQVAWTEKPQK